MLLIVLVLMQYVYYCVHCTKWTFYFLKLRTLRVFLLIVLVEEYGVLVLLEGQNGKKIYALPNLHSHSGMLTVHVRCLNRLK